MPKKTQSKINSKKHRQANNECESDSDETLNKKKPKLIADLEEVINQLESDSEKSEEDTSEGSTQDMEEMEIIAEGEAEMIQGQAVPLTDHMELLRKYEDLQRQHEELARKFKEYCVQPEMEKGALVTNQLNKEKEKKTNQKNLPNSSQTSDTLKKSKPHKPPPLICYNININKLLPEIKNILTHTNFFFKKINTNITHIYTENLHEYTQVKTLLLSNKNKFYSFTPPEEKYHSFLIKNLDKTFTINDLKEAYNEIISLNNLKIEIIKISKFLTPHMRNNNRNGFWLIQISNKSDIPAFLKIKKILNSIIIVEKLQSKQIPQCKNCQRIGHAASNCNMPFRCVKCDTPHSRGECKLPTAEQIKNNPNTEHTAPKCVNCGTTGHPASYRKCPKYIELVTRINERRQKIHEHKNFKIRTFNNFVKPNISYSNAVTSNRNTQTTKHIQNTQLKPATPDLDIANYTAKLTKILPTLPHDPIQRKIALLAFITEHVLN